MLNASHTFLSKQPFSWLQRLFLVTLLAASSINAAEPDHWIGTWMASPQPVWGTDFAFPTGIPATLKNQTIRQIVRVSVGGQRVRILLSNEYGATPLTINAAHIAMAATDSAILPKTDHTITFNAKSSVTIPAGAALLSDPIDLAVAPLSRLAVSLFLSDTTPATTFHWDGREKAYFAQGNQVAAERIITDETTEARIFLSGIQVESETATDTVVAIGDSITDGNAATINMNTRWPDFLATRLESKNKSVLNAGISGARLLGNQMGVNLLARFDRDVLSQPKVKTVIVMIGINDIAWPDTIFDQPKGVAPSVDSLILGYQQLIARAHARGIRIIGATLTPFEGALPNTPLSHDYYTPEKEAMRQQINAWIRTSNQFDAIIDFDQVLQDKTHPTRFKLEFDSGDKLHPSDQGYKAMADAVDLDALF